MVSEAHKQDRQHSDMALELGEQRTTGLWFSRTLVYHSRN
jgi:hypothetical protein